MNIRQKDLILLPYPFSNLSERKVRPALVVSNNNFNSVCSDCIAVPITSVIKEEPFSILINQSDLNQGKLIRKSRLRLDKIFSVEKRMIQMKIGVVSDNFFDKIKYELTEVFS